MAYREVGTMDIDQVIRRWLAGEKIRAIARLTGRRSKTQHSENRLYSCAFGKQRLAQSCALRRRK
jgi:hypothetical protein